MLGLHTDLRLHRDTRITSPAGRLTLSDFLKDTMCEKEVLISVDIDIYDNVLIHVYRDFLIEYLLPKSLIDRNRTVKYFRCN